MAKGTYGIAGFCVVDAQPIPRERLTRGSVTCSKECAKIRREAQRAQQDEKECRYCRKPSTPHDRETYALFRRLQKKWPGFIELITTDQFNKLKKEHEAAVPQEATQAAAAPQVEIENVITWK